MNIPWERVIWRRETALRVELSRQGPSFATLIKLLSAQGVFIADVMIGTLHSTLVLNPGVVTHRPAQITVLMRTKGRKHEEQVLEELNSFGYTYRRE